MTEASPSRRPIAALLFVLAVVAIGLAARLPKFATRTLWFDEVYQDYVGRAPDLGELGRRVAREERNPPAGYLLTRAGLLVSNDEAGARLPSLLLGLACIPLGWAAGRGWGGRAAAAWLAAFAAFAPAYVFYSREARLYAPGLAAVFAFVAAAGWFRRRPSVLRGVAFAAAAGVAVSLQYAGAVVVAVGLLAVFLGGPADPSQTKAFRRGWWAAAASAGTLAVVWAVTFMKPQLSQRGGGDRDREFAAYFWSPASPASAAEFATGALPDFLQYTFLGGPTGPRWTALALLALAPAIFAAARARTDRRHRAATAFAAGTLLAFVALAGAGLHPLGGTRHCLPLTPGLLLLLALGLERLGRVSRPLALAWGGLSLALMTYGTVHTMRGKHDHALRPLAAEAAARMKPADRVICPGNGSVTVFRHYESLFPWAGRITYCGEGPGDAPGPAFEPTFADALAASGRVWVVEVDPPEAAFRETAERTARVAEVIDLPKVRVALWVPRTPTAEGGPK